jgi:hypothetical protein
MVKGIELEVVTTTPERLKCNTPAQHHLSPPPVRHAIYAIAANPVGDSAAD